MWIKTSTFFFKSYQRYCIRRTRRYVREAYHPSETTAYDCFVAVTRWLPFLHSTSQLRNKYGSIENWNEIGIVRCFHPIRWLWHLFNNPIGEKASLWWGSNPWPYLRQQCFLGCCYLFEKYSDSDKFLISIDCGPTTAAEAPATRPRQPSGTKTSVVASQWSRASYSSSSIAASYRWACRSPKFGYVFEMYFGNPLPLNSLRIKLYDLPT